MDIGRLMDNVLEYRCTVPALIYTSLVQLNHSVNQQCCWNQYSLFNYYLWFIAKLIVSEGGRQGPLSQCISLTHVTTEIAFVVNGMSSTYLHPCSHFALWDQSRWPKWVINLTFKAICCHVNMISRVQVTFRLPVWIFRSLVTYDGLVFGIYGPYTHTNSHFTIRTSILVCQFSWETRVNYCAALSR